MQDLIQQTKKMALVLAIGGAFVACQTARPGTTVKQISVATISQEGLVDCFQAGLTDAAGKPLWCEASAVLFDGTKVWMANDKNMPKGQSSVFFWPSVSQVLLANTPPQYLSNEQVMKATKFEDFAQNPDGSLVFLTTAFDRIKEGSNEWDGFNSLLYWATGQEAKAQMLRLNGQDVTSVGLRALILEHLTQTNGGRTVKYFKIEGLAALSDRLILGIREEGNKFDDFQYKIKFLSLPYRVRLDGSQKIVEVAGPLSTLADVNPVQWSERGLRTPLGLSSIEYDRHRKCFWILTSFESGENLGAYLWTATETQLGQGKMTLVTYANGQPMAFTHKAEDLTILDGNRLLVVHDDDRVQTDVKGAKRQPHQAAFSIVSF
jgi:hypothetical protein